MERKYSIYRDYLLEKGYKHESLQYQFLDSTLQYVFFEAPSGASLVLGVFESKEFEDYVKGLPEDSEVDIEGKGDLLEVTQAFIEAPLCNVADFLDGSTKGISLVSEPSDYYEDSLDKFELCVELQTPSGLAKHTLMIMKNHVKLLEWVSEVLSPILEDADYYLKYDSLLNIDPDIDRDSSNPVLQFEHINGDDFFVYTDCITGEPRCTGNLDIFWKTKEETRRILLEKIWKKPMFPGDSRINSKYSYLYSGEPKDTKETHKELMYLYECLRYPDRAYREESVRSEFIPDRYKDLLDKYEKDYSSIKES